MTSLSLRAFLKRHLPARVIRLLRRVRYRLRGGDLSVGSRSAASAAAASTLRPPSFSPVDERLAIQTALQLAAQGGHLELLKAIHQLGADLSGVNHAVIKGAAANGHVEILRYLKSTGISLRGDGDAALRLAAAYGHTRCVEYIQRTETIRADPAIHPSLKPLIWMYLDVFGYCNLRCPSCPVQNWPLDDKAFTTGAMTDDLLRRILDKASGEMTLAMVGLFNWTEPLLNPQLPRLVEIVNSYGVWSGISSNLNLLKDPEALMRANPSWIRVSVSGYRQDIYERGHRNGRIEHVKQNMRRLADAKRTTHATTEFELFFHRYLDNEDDEAPMKQYAEDLGYRFLTGWAYMMPLEKVLTYADPSQPETPLTDEDRVIMDRLALRTNAMLDVCSRHKLTSCSLQDEFLALNVRGDVYLCCASSGRAKNMIGNFLELSFDEIQRRKYAHSLCGKCLQRGLPVYLNQIDPAFDDIGLHARAEFRSQRSHVS